MSKLKFKSVIIGITALGVIFTAVSPANANVTYTCAGAKATIVSSKSSVTGTEGNDVIVLLGLTGQTVNAGAGTDIICGTKYNDVINSGAGNDTVYGNDGDDLISGSTGNDQIYGNNGVDRINGGDGNDLVYAGAGNDIVEGAAGSDTLYGDGGNDSVTGNAGDDKLYGGVGNDKIYGSSGKDNIKGDAGDDSLYGEDDNDLLYGGAGKDSNFGGKGSDKIYGEDDNDKLYGAQGNDIITGGKGDDLLDGGDGDDTLNGNEGKNSIKGGKGKDKKTLGSKDTNADVDATDIINGSTDGGITPNPDESPTDVVVPTAMKTVLNNFKTFMDRAVTQKDITGLGWQNTLPDSIGNTVPSLDGAAFTKVTWNLASATYCVSIKKDNVNYKLTVKNAVATINGGACSDANKDVLPHALLAAYFGTYSDYIGNVIKAGELVSTGDASSLPSSSVGMAPYSELIKNIKWKTTLNTATNVTTIRVVISGTVDGVNYFRHVIVFTEGVKTASSTIAGIGSTANLN